MKLTLRLTTLGMAIMISAVLVFGQAKTKVAFRTVKGQPSRYITAAGGSLNSEAQSISARQIFTLVDLNGDTLEDGDSVRIQYGDKYWREQKGTVVLAGGIPDQACTFTLERYGEWILLKAHDGTWVSAPGHGGSLETSKDKDDSYRVLDLKLH